MTTRGRKMFIAGNGPSLKELDFSWLQGVDWLGMNAAYRHWDRIGIYPSLYCCLDKVVVKSHAEQILRLHSEGRSEEHTSELQSLMRISYAVFCLKKKKTQNNEHNKSNTGLYTRQETSQ